MTIDGDIQVAKSFLGSICSLIILCLTLAYAYQKIEVLISKKDVDILSAVKELVYSDTDKFTYENGLNVAFAFTSFSNEEEWELDPAYGTLVFNSYEWGIKPDGTVFTERKRLPSHVCTKDELAIDESAEEESLSELNSERPAHFFKVHPSGESFTKLYRKKFICLDKENLEINGDFSSTNGRQLDMQLIKCSGGPANGCKTDEQIISYFRNKWILMYYNQIRFDSFEFGLDAIQTESQIKWLPINTQQQTTYPFKILTT